MKQPNPKITFGSGTLDDIELPLVIYKYRYWSDDFHKRFITEKEIFMASPRTFEDDLDCHNPTRFDLLTAEQIYDYYLWSSKEKNKGFSRQQHRDFARHWFKKSPVHDKEKVKKWMADTMEEYYDHDGILSLTENFDNEAMWQKYSDNGKGFCIGYNAREMFNHIGGGGVVHYVNDLPIIYPEPFMSFEEALMYRVFFKTNKWKFEEEYRAKKFWTYKAQVHDRQIKLPNTAFNRIILGENISTSDEEEIIKAVKYNIGDIEIVKRKKTL